MDTMLLNLPHNLVRALCNTLLHSLWLGLLLAAVAGLVVMLTRRSGALFRYNLLLAVLVVFTTAVLATFVQELNSEPKNLPATGQVYQTVYTPVVAVAGETAGANYYQTASSFLNTHANVIVLVWFLIVLARTLQLLTGLQSLYFLRRRHVSAIGGNWEERVNQLARQLGIKRLVRVAESGIAKVPMVIGHLKPLILIPAGLISALPPSGIEAILVHELAHIRRRDYLTNLLIGILEIIFFFNPAVLWIASLIREERENCCDDIAVANTGNKVDYIKALVACREYRPGAPAYAMAFSGRKDHLLGRVKRMVSNRNLSLNLMERAILAAGLLVCILFATAFSTPEKASRNEVEVKKETPKLINFAYHDTTRKKVDADTKAAINLLKNIETTAAKQEHNETDTGKVRIYRLEEVGERTNITLTNNGVKTRLIKTYGVLYQVNYREGHIISLQLNGITVAPGQYGPYLTLMDHSNVPTEPLAALARKAGTITPVKANLSPVAALNTKTAALNVRLDSLHQQRLYKPYTETYKPYHDGYNRDQLAADLVKDGIINTPADLTSFKLSNKEFIVNGNKMPDDIYQKFKMVYVPVPTEGKQGDWSWLYNYNVN